MKYDCNKLYVRKSVESNIQIIDNIIKKYYESNGYDIHEPRHGIKKYFGCKYTRHAIWDMLFGNKYSYSGSYMITAIQGYRIQIECYTITSLQMNKGLCQALNKNMPDDITWILDIIDDVIPHESLI